MTGQCENDDCQKPAKYALFKILPNGEKKWLHVCRACEGEIGNENLKRIGRQYYQNFI